MNSVTLAGHLAFIGKYPDVLEIDPGAVFGGGVSGGTGSNTLELAGTSAATLSGFGTNFTGFQTILVEPGADWTLNGSDTIGPGVTLIDTGTLTNTAVIASTATVAGSGVLINNGTILGGGIEVVDVPVTVTGPGIITGGGTITETVVSGVVVTGAGTVIDTGLILGGISFAANQQNRLAIDAATPLQGTVAGGNDTTLELLSSAGTGTPSGWGTTFTGFGSVLVDPDASWVSAGLFDIGLTVAAGGSLINAGAISPPELSNAAQDAPGVALNGAGSSLTNQADAIIEAGQFAVVSDAQNTTVTNAGAIDGADDGVEMLMGGSVTNSGEIDGFGTIGVVFSGGPGTLTNTGTINGSDGAVQFTGSYADRVIITSAARFGGAVTGGSGSNTLELAGGSGTLSLANGTLTVQDSAGVSSFVNFTDVVVDQGLNWVIGGIGFASVTNAGTLSGSAGLVRAAAHLGRCRRR